jgi:hypothetical protein
MEGNIQNIKIDKKEIWNSWYALAWLPIFAFIWYLFIKADILSIQAILYPIKLMPLILLIKLAIAILIIMTIPPILGGIAFYYDTIKKLIKAYRIAHNKI